MVGCTSDARWSSQLAFLERLIRLEGPISEYLGKHSQSARRALTPREWTVLKEVCNVLEYAREVTVGIQSGGEGILSRAIFLSHELVNIVSLPELEEFDFTLARDTHGDRVAVTDRMKPVAEMQECVRTAVEVFREQLRKRGVDGVPSDVELIALYLDPRYRSLGADVCGDGDRDGTLLARAKRAVMAVANTIDHARVGGGAPPPEGGRPGTQGSGSGDKPTGERPAKRSRSLFDRREREREEAAARAFSVSDPTRNAKIVAARLEREMFTYDHVPPIANGHFNLVDYWQKAAKPSVNKDGAVVGAPKFPLLSILARVYLSADSTSCRSGHDIGVLAATASKLRCSMKPDLVDEMMFLRLNADRIPEVAEMKAELDAVRVRRESGRAAAAAAAAEFRRNVPGRGS